MEIPDREDLLERYKNGVNAEFTGCRIVEKY